MSDPQDDSHVQFPVNPPEPYKVPRPRNIATEGTRHVLIVGQPGSGMGFTLLPSLVAKGREPLSEAERRHLDLMFTGGKRHPAFPVAEDSKDQKP